MKRFAVPFAAFAATAAFASPAAAEVQIQSSGPLVELSINESVAADPDLVDLSAGVTTQAQTAVEAMRANATQMSRVVERIEKLGIKRDDIQTSGISLNPQYEWEEATRRQIFRGYQVMNRVNVILRNIDRTGDVLDALVAAGATDLGGINFRIDDATQARAQARASAMEKARLQATEYARMAGYTGIRLLEVSENVTMDRPMPMGMIAASAERSQDASTPVRPGQVETFVTVAVIYEMTR